MEITSVITPVNPASRWWLSSYFSRADWRPTIVNEIAGISLVLRILPKAITFKGDAVLDLVEPGLYHKHQYR
jgi:hypothetical protein